MQSIKVRRMYVGASRSQQREIVNSLEEEIHQGIRERTMPLGTISSNVFFLRGSDSNFVLKALSFFAWLGLST